ncbi:MAG: hypothetical protein KatS3mg114_0160 [Planctomycetaceae bacterium]|nr:MAG: hypothetical protein KatS3mg114_0160 [Planctomycetaceae bacterium]
MNQQIRNLLRSFVLEARRLLEQAVAELLEGRFNIYERAGKLVADRKAKLDHLDDAERDLRTRVLRHLDDLQADGLSPLDAYRQLLREAAFTWLNRLVAFKMLEARKLSRETISRWDESNGYKHWLAEHDDAYQMHQRGGEHREAAYRRFLFDRCRQLASEIRVLFDPDSLPSRLIPPPRCLRQIVERLNDPQLADAWLPGNEESLGWIYQDFNEQDLEPLRGLAAFKIPKELVPAKTQKFTLRWVVEYLVHNTLGRLWLELHPDSEAAKSWHYLVPLSTDPEPRTKNKGQRTKDEEARSVKEIRLLDPACGTMHFGLVAFDLFEAMYREELANAGKPGWPAQPPVAHPDDIPAAILEHNLHGIDIDLRAVQIAALALYLKAKTLVPKKTLRESRLACANVHMLNGDRLGEFLKQAGLDQRPIYRRILDALREELRDSEQLGSLLPLEKRIKSLVEAERQRYAKEGRQPDLFGWHREQFESEAGQGEFWEMLEIQIGQALDAFARDQAKQGVNQTFFVGETVKGLRLLELLAQQYDVVVTNPPFLDSRDMNDQLKRLIDKNYPQAKRNLYAPFTLRCVELLRSNGRLGIITGQTFMFIKTFEQFRNILAKETVIESLLQFDYGLFEGVRVDTAAYVLRKEPDEGRRREAIGTYFRLVKEPDAESKHRRFEQALERLRQGEPEPLVFRYRQTDFAAIPGSPWVYWITPGLRKLFETLPKLGDVAQPRQGLATADNFRFLRYWWEVGTERIAFGCRDAQEALKSRQRWFPYMKGGSFRRWYGNQEYVVNWENDGKEIKNLESASGRIASRPQNTDYYFRRGVTYSYLTSGNFSARVSPGGFIFDVAGSSLFPADIPLVLAVLNSRFALYGLRLINPTVNFQVGDLARLPIPTQSSPRLEALVEQAIELAKQDSREDETTWDFVEPPPWPDGLQQVAGRHAQLAEIERQIDEEVYRLYGISPEDRAAIETELESPPMHTDEHGSDSDDETASETQDASDAIRVDPSSSVAISQLAQDWISWAVGKVFAEQAFIEAVEKFADAVLHQLEARHGEAAAEAIIRQACGEGPVRQRLADDLAGPFFKRHLSQYRKRPIYWLLQPPRSRFGVWLFARRYDKDTLFKILLQVVEPKIRLETSRLDSLRSEKVAAGESGKEARRLAREIEKQEDFLSELRDFEEKLRRAANLHLDPDLNDGVALNIAPLWELVPWKDAKKYWDELMEGKYEWSSIGKQLREKGLVR